VQSQARSLDKPGRSAFRCCGEPISVVARFCFCFAVYWWAALYDVRTEIAQTADLLQKAFEAVAQAKLLAAAEV
jgi:hypothetical protein